MFATKEVRSGARDRAKDRGKAPNISALVCGPIPHPTRIMIDRSKHEKEAQAIPFVLVVRRVQPGTGCWRFDALKEVTTRMPSYTQDALRHPRQRLQALGARSAFLFDTMPENINTSR